MGGVPSGASASKDTYDHTAKVSQVQWPTSGVAIRPQEPPRANLAGIMVEGVMNRHELGTMGRDGHVHGAYISRKYCLC